MYTSEWKFEWDENKNEINIRTRGLDFADAIELFHRPMRTRVDRRIPYGEDRWMGFGLFRNRLMAVVFTIRGNNVIRLISFRKANRREQAFYEKEIPD
jgi:uncharacterized protein